MRNHLDTLVADLGDGDSSISDGKVWTIFCSWEDLAETNTSLLRGADYCLIPLGSKLHKLSSIWLRTSINPKKNCMHDPQDSLLTPSSGSSIVEGEYNWEK